MIEAPKRFNENPEKATEIKKNGTEHFGLDQDGVAKTIAAELLLTKENVGLGKVANKTEAELVASGAIADALALKFDKSSLADNYDGGATKALSAEKGKDLNDRVSVLEGDDETEGSVAKTVKDAVTPIIEDVDAHAALTNNPHSVTKAQVGLGSVDNTSDSAKPVSTLQQAAIDTGLNRTMAEIMGFAPRNLMTLFGVATVAEAFAALRAISVTGDFRSLRLGDYIDLPSLSIGADSLQPDAYPARNLIWNASYENLRLEIVGFDDYYLVGNTAVPNQHHVTMMFKNLPTLAQFNTTNITTGDYPGSMLFHWLHEQFEPALISAIGLTPRPVDRIIGTVANWGWVGSETIFLPTNVNIFGTTGFSHTHYGTGTQTQFALFALNPNRKLKKYNGSRTSWWLAEPSAGSSAYFCTAYYSGTTYINYASNTSGVDPAFLI